VSLLLKEDSRELLKNLRYEIFRCAFCGFCEYACPTLNFANFRRQFGPRGRIQLISMALSKGIISKASVEGIYTCLGCGACAPHCPAKINIAEAIRAFKALIAHGLIKVKPDIAEMTPYNIVGRC